MKKKIQIVLSDESWSALESLTNEANEGFVNGTINYSDVVNDLIATGKIDIRGLQAKHTNIRKSLRLMASQKEIDIESAIKTLMDLKSKGVRKTTRGQMQMESLDL